MKPEKAQFTQEKETMLITPYGRALQSRSKNPVLRDPWAEEAIQRVDADFAKFKIGLYMASLVANRARQLDLWTSDFLSQHPDAVVLHLGCGLDSRIYRVDPPPGVHWFDVDYPDVIDLRRSLYPERVEYRMIGSPLSDLRWLDEIPRNHPTLIVMEGVTMYLTEDVVKPLLNRLVDHFPAGGQMAFDVFTPEMIAFLSKKGRNLRGTNARFHWGLGDPKDIAKIEPRLELVEERRIHQLVGFAGTPWRIRMTVRMMERFLPGFRIMRCLLYRF